MRRPGVITSSESKERMRHELQRLLREDRIHIDDETTSSRVGDVQNLVKQLKQCEYIYKPSTAVVVAERKRVITGKLNGKNDDMAIAMMMLSYWPIYYYNNDGRCVAVRRS